MADAKNLAAVAAEAVLEVPERYPGYREDLVRQLMGILRRQDEDVGQNTRRSEIRRLLESFGTQVAAKTQEDDA